MIIKVLERVDTETEEDKDEFRVVGEIEIEGVDPFRITPVREKVGSPLTIQELTELVAQIQPSEPLNQDEPDSYYAQGIAVWRDGSLSTDSVDIPHHIGLRVALASVLERYSASDHLLIQIS
jgi:hypothetical protein